MLQQIMHSLTDADMSFDAAHNHLLSSSLMQRKHKRLGSATAKAILFKVLVLAQTSGNFCHSLSQTLRILLSYKNWKLQNLASLDQYGNISRQICKIRNMFTKAFLHINNKQNRISTIKNARVAHLSVLLLTKVGN
jgi:hypothetical protein